MKRVSLLDQGYIELLGTMPEVDLDFAVVQAARVSFLEGTKGTDKDIRLISYLMKNHHTSPLEMVEFKFRVHAPLIVWWQWVRHRTWNYNAQSGRYVPFQENSFYVPDRWRLQSVSNKQGSDGFLDEVDVAGRIQSQGLREDLIQHYANSYALYERALKYGVAKEQARLFLPGFSVYYTWIVKTDLHNMLGFLRLRMAEDAQSEIRDYARAMYLDFVKPATPKISAAFEHYQLKPEKSKYPFLFER